MDEGAAEAVKPKKRTRKVTIEEPDASPSQRAARLRRASEAERIRANSEASGTEGAESQRMQSGPDERRDGTQAVVKTRRPHDPQFHPKLRATLPTPLDLP